jgi:cytochrome oxidase Cu insertion factor (SCO1/SenC/PrrC family)
MNLSAFRTATLAAISILAAVLIAWQFGLLSPDGGRPGSSGIAKIGGPFELTDQNGKPRKSTEFQGRFMLIYFGYTYCPDVCPTALQIMSNALQSLGSRAKAVQPIFITVDPSRDTPAHLKEYVKNFYPGMIGLTGDEKLIKAAAKNYRVYYAKALQDKDKPDADSYLMDHSSIVFLMDKKGRYVTHFSHQTNAALMAHMIAKHL